MYVLDSYGRIKDDEIGPSCSSSSSSIGASGFSGFSGAASFDLYTNPEPTPVPLGGISAGSTFVSQTMTQMWTALLYPYQYPAFTGFSITGYSSPIEVGYTIPTSGLYINFNWNTSNSSDIETESISIINVTMSEVLATGLMNSGSNFPIELLAPIQNVVSASQEFEITGINTKSQSFSSTLIFNWEWMMFYGESSSPELTPSGIQGLGFSGLSTAYAGDYSMHASGYKYICQADAAGGQINSVKDQETGFNVPLADTTADPEYSHVDGGGSPYAVVSGVTNGYGVIASYRVYRTYNVIGSTIVLVVA
jgi:hypothetical protein